MLLNSFYSIIKLEHTVGKIRATIQFDPGHAIFKGHFPGNPIVPGVCMVQIVREVLEAVIQKKISIAKTDTIKFLSLINPDKNQQVELSIAYLQETDNCLVDATLFDEHVTFFKLVKATMQNV